MRKRDIIQGTVHRFREGKIKEAYDFITEHSSLLEPDTSFYNFRYAFQCQLGNKELAFNIFKEAIKTHGMWYEPEYLRTRESISLLREHEDFDRLLQINIDRYNKEHFTSPYIETRNEGKDHFLFSIHSDYQTLENVQDCINEKTFKDYTIIYPRATEQTHHNAFKWREDSITFPLLKEYIDISLSRYNIDISKAMVHSFHTGSTRVLKAIIDGYLPINNILFYVPDFNDYDNFKNKFSSLQDKNIKLFIITSTSDVKEYEKHKQYQKELEKHNVRVHLHVLDNVPGLEEHHMMKIYPLIKEFFL